MTNRRYFLLIIFIAAVAPHVYRFVELSSTTFHDDAYYYFQTARNIAAGNGLAFDGYNATNGFHPLWMGVCAIVALIAPEPHTYYYLILGVNLLIAVLFSVLVFRMFSGYLGDWFAGFAVALINWNLYTSLNLFSGLETALYLLLFFFTIDRFPRTKWTDRKDLLVLGVLFGLTFLARTSFILFAPVLLGYVIVTGRLRDFKSFGTIFVYLGLPALAVCVPYLLWNYSLTGHFQQISGLVKDLYVSPYSWERIVFKGLSELPKSIVLRPLWLNVFMVVWPCLFLFVLVRCRPLPRFLGDERLYLLGSFSIVAVIYYMLSYSERISAWHFMVPWVTVQILFAHLLKATYDFAGQWQWGPTVVATLVIAMAMNQAVQIPLFVYRGTKIHPYYLTATDYGKELADWISHNVPKDAKVGVFNAGYLGFFSGRTVVNLDGLANGVELYRYLKDGRGAWKYALDKKLDYIADYYYGSPPLPPDVAAKLKLVHRVGPTKILLRGKPTYIDGYVWKIEHD